MGQVAALERDALGDGKHANGLRPRPRCCARLRQCVDDEKEAKKLASAKTVNAVQTLARADRRHAAVTEQWDIDLWALNTPAGTVDLRTGILRPHRRTDYITKITSVAP